MFLKRSNTLLRGLCFLPILFTSIYVVGQENYVVRGKLIDSSTQLPIEQASVFIDSTLYTLSNRQGVFEIVVPENKSYNAVITHVSYTPIQVRLTPDKRQIFELQLETLSLNEVTLTVAREEFENSKSVERLNLQQLNQIPSFDIYSSLGSLKEVDITSHGLQFQTINTRGFTSTANTRFLQIVDGMDNQAPGLGFSLGNFSGIDDLDIESMELSHGPESSRYGTGAFNGILFIQSKDPFLTEGFSFSTNLAANRFKEGLSGYTSGQAEMVWRNSIRYAKVINDKLAFKVNFSLFQGNDWVADDVRNIGRGESEDFFNPAYDGINIYGDEEETLVQTELSSSVVMDNSEMVEVPPRKQTFYVTRTGYRELALVDYDMNNIKLNGAIHYKLKSDSRIIIQANYANGSTMYTGDNRTYLGEMSQLQSKLEYKHAYGSVRGYTTFQKINRAYDSRFLAINLNRLARSDREWLSLYELTFGGWLVTRGIGGFDHRTARSIADSEFQVGNLDSGVARFTPGTPEFAAAREQIINTQGFENGAGFRDQSRLYHIETDYDISRFTANWNTIVGASYRLYDPESNGIIFPDTIGNDITMYEYSFFTQAQRELLDNKLRTTISARVDKNENFEPRISPGLSVLYRLGQDQRVRFSVQSGFRFPSLREQFAFQNLGRATLVGGLTGITDQLNLPGNSFFDPTVQEFNQVVDEASNLFDGTGTLTREQAELANLNILFDGILGEGAIAPIKPEKVLTLETGFRSYFFNRKLYFDINGYINFYTDFIGVKRVFKPKTSPQTDLFLAAGQLNRPSERDLYFINTNSTEQVITNGVAAKIDYHPTSAYTIGFNATWSKISTGGDDAFIPSFNTPEWKGNVSIARKFKRGIQAKGTVRMRTEFQWQSNFGDGLVERYAIVDIQVTKDIPSLQSHVKIGVSNALNSYYTDVFGGPQIGALPFIQLMYNPKK